MKAFFTVTATTLLMCAALAHADLKQAEIKVGQTVTLTNCRGTATLDRDGRGDLILYVRGSQCANLQTMLVDSKLNGQGNSDRWIDVRIDESIVGEHPILIGSNAFISSQGTKAGALGDMLIVNVPLPYVNLVPQIPSNWSYDYRQVGFGSTWTCGLVDSNGDLVVEMSDSVCTSGTKNVPSGTIYGLLNGACYLFDTNSYALDQRVSANAVTKSLCD